MTSTVRFTILLIQIIVFSSIATAQSLHYVVSMKADNPYQVNVSATLMGNFGTLQMDPYGIPDDIDKGWAHFVSGLKLKDEKGNDQQIEWNDQTNEWSCPNWKEFEKYTLTYSVNLTHAEFDWRKGGGVDARPTVFGDGAIYLVTKALFLYPKNADLQRSTVDIIIPESWTSSTAWQKDGQVKNRYHLNNLYELHNNVLMLGEHSSRELTYGPMTITLALTPTSKSLEPVFVSSFQKLIPVFEGIFGELPKVNYLICLSNGPVPDGEAYNNSFHQIFDTFDLEKSKPIWLNTMAHELFHYWNGEILYSEDFEAHYWFMEGFTEYYANVSLVRAGLIDRSFFIKKLEQHFSRVFYTRKFYPVPAPNLADAGESKLGFWPLVYGGGASFAFCVDVEIRQITKNEKSLDDVMRRLYMEFGKANKPFDISDLKRVTSEIAGRDLSSWYDQFVLDIIDMPLGEQCRKAGLNFGQFADEFHLSENSPNAQLFHQIIGQ